MDPKEIKNGNKECEILSGDGGLKDILQLLKKQSEKMERLGIALYVKQDGMRQNTLATVKTSFKESAKVLGSLFNTHECLMKSGVKIHKRLENIGETFPNRNRSAERPPSRATPSRCRRGTASPTPTS